MAKTTINISIELKEVTPHTMVANYKDYFDLNASAIALNNFIIVIDALVYPRQAKEFREYLEQKYNLPVKFLFITHFHGDHVYGMSSFKDVEIFGSVSLIKNMKERMNKSWTKEAFDDWKKNEPETAELVDEIEIIIPHNSFETKHVIVDKGLRVEFFHSGGHTECSSYAYFPDEKVLFSGDLIAAGFWPFISDPKEDFEGWMKSFEHMLTLDIKSVIPGHGPVVGKDYIKEQLTFMTQLKTAVLKAISEGKAQEEVEIPTYSYEPAEDWQIPRALEYLYYYYSKNKDLRY